MGRDPVREMQGSPELYVLKLLNLPLQQAREGLWEDGFLICEAIAWDGPAPESFSARGRGRA